LLAESIVELAPAESSPGSSTGLASRLEMARRGDEEGERGAAGEWEPLLEIQPGFGAAIVTSLARLGARPVEPARHSGVRP
jgi:hypothetical protein